MRSPAFCTPVALLAATLCATLLGACQMRDGSDAARVEQTHEPLADIALAPGAVVAFAVGDIADCRRTPAEQSGAAQTAALVESELAEAANAVLLTLGDHTYPIGTLDEFRDCYGPTWGRFLARTYPVPGNHEYYSPHAGGYYAYFGSRAGPEWRGYYSVTLGSWKVLALNSVLQGEAHRVQLDWLRAELARTAASCILAFWHHPRYSSGGHGDNIHMQSAWEMLHAARADIVLAAHDHGYERFAPQNAHGQHASDGPRQFVVGTGGADLTLFRRTRAHSEVRENSSHGVLKLVLAENAYAWEYLAVGGGHVDSGRAHCNQPTDTR